MVSKLFKSAIVFLSTLIAIQSFAVELRRDYPESYIVKPGDTLWDISALFLSKPWLWPEIWQVNPQVGNPHLIYPGDVLSLVYIDGKPVLMSRKGDVKLSPTLRTSDLGSSIPAIPVEAISGFLSRSRVLDNETIKSSPYIVAGEGKKLITGVGDIVFGRGEFESLDTRFYGIYRPGQTFRDPETREKLGIQAVEIGSARVIDYYDNEKQRKKDPRKLAKVQLTATNQEVRLGDRLMSYEDETVLSTFYPKAPSTEITGSLIAVEGGITSIGRFDVVVVNRGKREGLETGDVLSIFKLGRTLKDDFGRGKVKLPKKKAGLLIVFKVFDKVAYGLVLDADEPLALMDEVGNP